MYIGFENDKKKLNKEHEETSNIQRNFKEKQLTKEEKEKLNNFLKTNSFKNEYENITNSYINLDDLIKELKKIEDSYTIEFMKIKKLNTEDRFEIMKLL